MKVREVHLDISSDERLLIYPNNKDRFISVDHQDRYGDGSDQDEWVTDQDAGLCIPRRAIDELIRALQDIRDGLDASPQSSTGEGT